MATLTRPGSCPLLTGTWAIEVASPVGESQATLPLLPVVNMLPSGRYTKSVRSFSAWPDGMSVSANPGGRAGAADATFDLAMTMAVVTEAVTSAAAINLRNCMEPPPHARADGDARTSGRIAMNGNGQTAAKVAVSHL